MKTRKHLLSYIAFLLLTAAAAPIYATTVTYSSQSSWLTAVSGVSTIDFEGIATPVLPVNYNAINGANFGGTVFTEYVQGSSLTGLTLVNGGQPYYNWGTGAILRGELYQGSLARLHVSLPTPVTAWGTNLMTGATNGGTYTIQINGGACTPACTAPTFALGVPPAFFGMTSDVAISSIDLFFGSGAYPIIDNFSTGTASGGGGDPGAATPEIGTLLLCATGLISIAKAKKLCSLVQA